MPKRRCNLVDHIIFVYGTLKKNQCASRLLETSIYYGTAETTPNYSLYSCNYYPALIEDSNGSEVSGELYGVTNSIKNILDEYEGVHEGHYLFKKITLTKMSLVGFQTLPDLDIHAYIYSGNLQNFYKINKWV